MTINVILNGMNRQFPEGYSLADITANLGLNNKKVVAEMDGKIVMQNNFATLKIKEGSKIELVKIVGGG